MSVTGSSSVLKASCPYSEVIDILCFLRPASSAASNLLGKDLSHVIVVMVRPKKKKIEIRMYVYKRKKSQKKKKELNLMLFENVSLYGLVPMT